MDKFNWKETMDNVFQEGVLIEKDLDTILETMSKTRNLDELKLHFPEYLEIYEAMYVKGIRTFYLGGSRSSGKTYFIIIIIIFTMLQKKRLSTAVAMWERIDNSDRTMREVGNVLDRILSKVWPEILNFWEMKDGTNKKSWNLIRENMLQEIRFLGKQDLDKGTISPPPGNFWGIRWFEEPTGTEERGGVNIEKVNSMIDAWNRFNGSIARYLKIGKEEDGEIPTVKTFLSFNPYNNENKIIENYIKYHDDIMEEVIDKNGKTKFQNLVETGYCSTINEELSEMYITTNFVLGMKNGVLPKESILFLQDTFKNNPDFFWTEGLGRAGRDMESCYGEIWSNVLKYQHDRINPYQYYKFKINIDVGLGAAPSHMALFGFRKEDDHYVMEVLDGRSFNRSQQDERFDPIKITYAMWEQIYQWRHKFEKMSERKLDITMDNDPSFRVIFYDSYQKIMEKRGSIDVEFSVFLHREKYYKAFVNAIRPHLISPLLASGVFRIFESRDKIGYDQMRNHAFEKNKWTNFGIKKIKDVKMGHDDARQCYEMAILKELPFLIKQIKNQENMNKVFIETLRILREK